MNYRMILVALLVIFSLSPSSAAQYQLGFGAGYNGGTGWQLYGELHDFARGFPFTARLEIGRSGVDPGNSAAARRIFINNATNGIPESSGGLWQYRLDLLMPVHIRALPGARLLFGPRYARFKGNFKYIGGNEDFDVVSSHWGLGVGLQSSFPISSRVGLDLAGGIDYFPKALLKGHDTSYSPDEVNINPREDYTYSDADNAINQPRLVFRLMIGFSYRL